MERFRKVCGLLSSSHDGERSAAALKATELLRMAGRTWDEVAIGPLKPSDGEREMVRLAMEVQRLHELLADERGRSRRLDDKLRNLKREMAKLQQRAAGSVRVEADGSMVDPDTGEVFGKKKLSKEERREYYRAKHYESMRERQKAADDERRREREANPRTAQPGDEQLRAAMREAVESGPLSPRSREFFVSVLGQETWTAKQRAAIENSLRWVFNMANGVT